MTSVAELRQIFLNYFQTQGHTIVPSSSLVPLNDSTLLFTNAGMVQFKETFLGLDKRAYQRAATCQRCVRAGGKHNDLENVGYTARHHTFFEMLGNFSFGNYFKHEAIHFSWEFLTQVLKLPPEKLWITVFEKDDEAAHIWLQEIKIDPQRFSRCGEKDNFWMMGDTGPCGPCSEIFYDHGPDVAGGPPGSLEEDGDRYIEIWNLVFMQYNRDTHGQLTPLPKPSVDTGMGLERLAAVMQGVHSNYEIDLFQFLLQAIANLAHCQDLTHSSLRVIADHIRACSFLIIDGVIPSNEGRGYVLRRIIRRAIRHGHKLGLRQPFFYQLVEILDQQMGAAYPELTEHKDLVARMLKQEEERFDETLDRGMRLLEQAIAELVDSTIPGDIVFKLYDTYGFPTDLTADIARERGLNLDLEGFEQRMAVQRSLSNTGQFKVDLSQTVQQVVPDTIFTGYDHHQDEGLITNLFIENQTVSSLKVGQAGRVMLTQTPFYAESGGQIGDKGRLIAEGIIFEVEDTQKMGQAYVHLGKLLTGELRIGEKLRAEIDLRTRQATARNHSATHLLHAALRQVFGTHVKQKGSLVAVERLRFDFSHFEAITPQQLKEVEQLVNEQILLNLPVKTQILHLEEALKQGAMALFGEKYDQKVRVLSMGEFSIELCGGTHVTYTGDIGLFKITAESGVAAGIRRIEAITGLQALAWMNRAETVLNQVAGLLKTPVEGVEERLAQFLEQHRQLEKEVARLQAKLANSQGKDILEQAVEVQGIKILAVELENLEVKQLRSTLDQLKSKVNMAVIVLATVKEDKVSLVAGVTSNLTNRINAGELVSYVAQQVDGKGGGRADMAQGGGTAPEHLPVALQTVVSWVKQRL